MSVLQTWLAGLIGLGALYIVASNGTNMVKVIGAVQGFFGGTLNTALKG